MYNTIPKVSIIVPVFNAGKYLQKCLETLQAQTMKELEIILILDCPTDGSDVLAKNIAAHDSRFIIVENSTNKHIGLSRNIGIAKATGEYIGFVDADDTIKNDYLAQLISVFLLDKSVDLTVCGFLGSETRVFKEISFIINEENIENVISLFDKYLLFPPYCKLYKRAIIAENGIKFNETINFSEDILFNLDYLAYCNKIHSYNYVGYNYRIVENSPNQFLM